VAIVTIFSQERGGGESPSVLNNSPYKRWGKRKRTPGKGEATPARPVASSSRREEKKWQYLQHQTFFHKRTGRGGILHPERGGKRRLSVLSNNSTTGRRETPRATLEWGGKRGKGKTQPNCHYANTPTYCLKRRRGVQVLTLFSLWEGGEEDAFPTSVRAKGSKIPGEDL